MSSSAADVTADEKKKLITASIRGIPDFPKAMQNPTAFRYTIDLFAEHYRDKKVDVIAGFEARGLIFGAPLALALNCSFVPLRKPGKLPGKKVSEEYITEYSTDKIEMHEDAIQPGQRVVLVDDLIATGGTLRAGINLVKKVGGIVVEAACVIELPALHGREKIPDTDLFVLIEKEGD
mmetsp:Transcript_12738/g.27591  ORF Transcript_12738/g.27591 Transcript_12738/m.27591 type:complete len:178 (+) Transcript_12738:189-722(+)|eukprot:CAMPEP_0202922754 /NCGR_PEP_ID=MMETSP1392-20130828/78091_1 /ASSEMBLY_ACC=CAM_ASM_000868 /TAXON_ID=225041 /ORGANISM="Chlamydomonas chlamydogama, Strain SAG 11-48b" /LENGTH=177 /DNA_ID=CAMNT_0049616399 /DNA_START=171 /DNA_END=704 /DNA_ORIENTATION=+